MWRLLAASLALVLLRADMFPDASNSSLPAAMTNLSAQGINLTPVTVKPALTQSPGSMVLTGGGWNINNWYGGGFGGQGAQWLFGTKDVPKITGGSPVAIGLVQATPKENCANNTAATGCNSALLLQNMGTAASTMVTSALTAYAETQSTAGLGTANAQGINSLGIASATSNAAGMGAYIDGRRYGASGNVRGMELRATNASDTDCLPAEHNLVSQCMALHVALVGPGGGPRRLSSVAIQVSGITSLFGAAREGLIFGNNSITEKTIADRTDATTSIYIDGNHDVAFQTVLPGTLGGKVLIGTPASYPGPGVTPFERAVQIYSGGIQLGDHGADINPPQFTFTKSRNATVGSHTAVQSNDQLGQITFSGSDGTVYKNPAAMILATVSGTVSSGIVPAKLSFWTSDTAGVSSERLGITPGGEVQVTGSLTVNGTPVADANSATAPRVVYYGDSLTLGNYARYVVLNTYNTGFTGSAGLATKNFSTQVSGFGGMKADGGLTYAPEFLDPYYQSRSPLNIALIWLGTNDISVAPQQTPATTWTRIQALAAAAKAKGFKVCVGTMISRVSNDTNLTTLNGLITAGWAAAGINCLVNFASDPNLAPNGSNYSNLTYYNADQIHLNAAGQQLAAAVAQTALNTYIATFTGPTPAVFNAPGGMTASALPTSAGAGGLYMCVDIAGVMYKKATCP